MASDPFQELAAAIEKVLRQVVAEEVAAALNGTKPGKTRPIENPLLYDVQDVVRILKVSKQMVYRLVHVGKLRPLKLGTRTVFTMEELQRFVKEETDDAYFSSP